MSVTQIPEWASRLYGELSIAQLQLERRVADLDDAVSQVADVLTACEHLIRQQDETITDLHQQHADESTAHGDTREAHAGYIASTAQTLLDRLATTRTLLTSHTEQAPAEPDGETPAEGDGEQSITSDSILAAADAAAAHETPDTASWAEPRAAGDHSGDPSA